MATSEGKRPERKKKRREGGCVPKTDEHEVFMLDLLGLFLFPPIWVSWVLKS